MDLKLISYPIPRYTLNICARFPFDVSGRVLSLLVYPCPLGDVGGQRTLRPYWRNYFEQTDALVWVVDSSDRLRMQDCKHELHSLLTEDVRKVIYFMSNFKNCVLFQRLAGASLLVFANKEDLPGSMTDAEIRDVWLSFLLPLPSIEV